MGPPVVGRGPDAGTSLLPALDDPPPRPALAFPDGAVTYPQLTVWTAALGAALAGLTRVAVWATPTLSTAVGIVAALRAGVVAVPINPRSGERELDHVVADAAPDAWAWTGADTLVHALPLFHVHGLVLGVLGPLRRGSALRHLGTFSTTALARAVDDGGTLVFGVPTHYHRLADELEVDATAAAVVGRARLLVSGSAALTAVDHARLHRQTGLAVRERYGLTETLIVTAARADEPVEHGAVGTPLTGTEVRLAPLEDGDGENGGLGAVQVRGPALFSGYLNRPDATAAATTADGWFSTGDIGRWTASGALTLVGRQATDLIKSGGFKIGAGEIENALLEHPAVAEAAVVGLADADLGERVVAYVVAAVAVDPLALVDHVATLLAPHKRPREVRFVPELPRNDMGKVVKSRLPR